MQSPAVLFVGWDACERDLVSELMAEGRMPQLATLAGSGLVADVNNPIGMATEPVWPTLMTGVGPDRHGAWGWRPLRPGTYRQEWRGPIGTLGHPPVWKTLSSLGVRSLVVDVPRFQIDRELDCIQVADWGTHGRGAPLGVWPPEVASLVHAVGTNPPVDDCITAYATGKLGALADGLPDQISRRTELVGRLARDQPVDLAMVVFGVGHCVGHQFWHVHDTEHWMHDPELRRERGDVVVQVYEALDEAVGRLVDELTPANVVVSLSHGMGSASTVPQLTDPVLRAIDENMGRPPRRAWAREFLRRAPNRAARLALRATGRDIERLAHYADGRRRFFPLTNHERHSAIRLNVAGREPRGRIAADEMAAVIDHLEAQFLALVDDDRGRPAVAEVIRVADHYRVDPAGLPDLLVTWDAPSPITTVRSPDLGVIHRPRPGQPPGSHNLDGRLYVAGDDVQAGPVDQVRAEDVAPTIAALLGHELADVDGRAITPVRLRTAP